MLRREQVLLLITIGILLPPCLHAWYEPAQKDAEFVKKGRRLYVQYCVSCHGPSGKGDGPAASRFQEPPPDLTTISERYRGFPTHKIMGWIDGEKAGTPHGKREMPVWGRQFRRTERGEAGALGEVYALTKYIESIQGK